MKKIFGRKLSGLMCVFGALLLTAGAGQAYEAAADSIAYKITLWKNGNPADVTNIVGKYAELSKEGIGEHPECTVQVSKEKKDKDTRWTISVTPKGDYGVYSVTYPVLYLPRLKDGYLIYPRDMGQKMEGVFDKANRRCATGYANEGRDHGEGLKTDAVYYGRYPETAQILQMILIENEEEGVMIWTPDTEPWVKDFLVAKQKDAAQNQDGLRVEVIHYPEDTGQKGTGFKSPYPVLTTPYKGGWYEAAQIYRQWALQQKWCAKGKIYDRKNTPEWFKKTHCWFANGWFYNMDQGGLAGIKKLQEIIKGKDIGTELLQWQKYYGGSALCPDYFPPHNETQYRNVLAYQEKGLHFAPYILTYHVTAEHYLYRYLAKWLARTPAGNPYDYAIEVSKQAMDKEIYECADIRLFKEELKKAWKGPVNEELLNALDCFWMPENEKKRQLKILKANWGKDEVVIDKLQFYYQNQWLCPGYKRVTDLFVGLAEQSLGTYKTHMQYWDVFPMPIFPCYDKGHGHPLGYGRWMIKGQHDLCAKVLDEFPAAIIFSESMAEPMLDVVHAYFSKDFSVKNGLPLFSTVYQGYVEYSSFPICGQSWKSGWEKAEDFASFLALATHWGYAAGGCVGPLVGALEYGPDDVRGKFLNDTVDARLKYRDFIAAGKRLKDPKVEGVTAKEVQGWVRPGQSPVPMNLAPVQASKWAKNGDEAKGLLLISNASAEKQTVMVDGQKIELEPFSWQGIEVPVK